jgi:hypothetical protein
MSFVTTQPELLGEAAGNLQGIGSAMAAGNSAAAAPTTGVIPAAAYSGGIELRQASCRAWHHHRGSRRER